jgi:hypothetical protein
MYSVELYHSKIPKEKLSFLRCKLHCKEVQMVSNSILFVITVLCKNGFRNLWKQHLWQCIIKFNWHKISSRNLKAFRRNSASILRAMTVVVKWSGFLVWNSNVVFVSSRRSCRHITDLFRSVKTGTTVPTAYTFCKSQVVYYLGLTYGCVLGDYF